MPPAPSRLARDYMPKDLQPILERNRFDGSIAVQAAHDSRETDWLLALAEKHEFVLGVVGWVDLTDERVGGALDSLQKHRKFRGVRHIVHDEPDDKWLLRDDVIRGLQELESRDLPYDLLLFPRHLPVVPRLIDEVPRLRLVIDHIAKPRIAAREFDEWARGLEELALVPRVYAKLSGMITEANRGEWKSGDLQPYVAHALKVFGPDRLMFGSDWPVCLLAGTWKETLAAFTQALGAQPIGVREKLLGGTAAEFYRLD